MEYEKMTPKDLAQVYFRDIANDPKRISKYGALTPYANAMRSLDSWEDDYFYDSGRKIGLRFLANAQTWKGEVAREVKAAIKKQLRVK